jgi:hypothetical protein
MDSPSEPTEPSDESVAWVTLREASEQAGVPVSKVRGLYRAGRIRSRKPADWVHKERPERRLVMVALDDVLAQVGSAERASGTADRPPADDVSAPSGTVAIDRDMWLRLTARLEDIQRSFGELAAARERAAREEEDRDALRETLSELQRRVERLERQYAAVDTTGPSASHGNSADHAPVPDPDVEVEWQVEEHEEPMEPSRFNRLRRRDHRP